MSQITLQILDELLLALHWTEAGNVLRMTDCRCQILCCQTL